MRCPHCGNQVPDTARACGHCGQWLDAAPSRRGLPGWVWGGVGGIVVLVAMVGVLLATGVISLPGQQSPAPPATSAPLPASTSPPLPTEVPEATEPPPPSGTAAAPPATPTAEPTGEPAEPVRVGLSAGEERVPANTPVVLSIAWVADTSEQVTDWLASVDLVVTLDGEPLPDTDDYWGEIEKAEDYDEDGDVEYASRWRYPVGILSPGTHSVETEYRLQWPVTDGFDDDGDGALDEYYEPWGYPLQITVEE